MLENISLEVSSSEPQTQKESTKLSDLEKRKNFEMANSALASFLSPNHGGREVHLPNFKSRPNPIKLTKYVI